VFRGNGNSCAHFDLTPMQLYSAPASSTCKAAPFQKKLNALLSPSKANGGTDEANPDLAYFNTECPIHLCLINGEFMFPSFLVTPVR
jgi:hypothetical protein